MASDVISYYYLLNPMTIHIHVMGQLNRFLYTNLLPIAHVETIIFLVYSY